MKKWKAIVERGSANLERAALHHKVINGLREITVAVTFYKPYKRIRSENIGNGYVRYTGIGLVQPNLTPCNEALVIAKALNARPQHTDSLRSF